MKRRCRFAGLAAFALSLTGCRGCVVIDQAGLDAVIRRFEQQAFQQAYLRFVGPMALASAIGMAAPPGGWGGVSVMSTETAWREWIWRAMNQQANESRHAASVVGMAAVPGELSLMATAVALEAHAVQFPKVERLPSLFEIQPIMNGQPDVAGPEER